MGELQISGKLDSDDYLSSKVSYFRQSMRQILRFLQVVYNIYAFILLFIFALILLPIVIICSLLPKKTSGNVIYKLVRYSADIILSLIAIRHENIFEAPHDTTKPTIFVFNHISYLDAIIILKAIRKQHIRGLGKYEIGQIPIMGFIYKQAVIMVNRSDKADRARSINDLKAALSNNISIILAPEGTFNETTKPLLDFFDGAFRIAIETNTPVKPILFLDTFDRLYYGSSFSLKPGKSRAVFLDEINSNGYELKDLPMLKQVVYNKMESALIKYKATWIKN